MAEANIPASMENVFDTGIVEVDRNYLKCFLPELSKLQSKESTCDIIIKIDGKQIHAHKVVLAVGSPYFSNFFFGELSGQQPNDMDTIKLEDFKFYAVNTIVQYFYTTIIKIDEETVKEIYRAADFLQVNWVKYKCLKYIEKILSTSNCIDFWQFTDYLCAQQLSSNIVLFILRNLSAISSRAEFLALSNERMQKMISHKSYKINVKALYIAMIKWTKQNVDERRPVFHELTKKIPIKSLDKEFITSFLTNDNLIISDSKCLKSCYDALLYFIEPGKVQNDDNTDIDLIDDTGMDLINNTDIELIDDTDIDLTKNTRSTPYIFVLSTAFDKNFIHCYNPYRECLEYIPPYFKISPFSAVASYNDFICISGGLANVHLQRNFIMYNTVLKQWSTSNFLNWGKAYHDMVVHNDVLYACDVDFFLEKFDFGTGIWSHDETKYISKMYRHLSADVLDGRIFAVSGFVPVKSALRSYDPREGKWQGEANHAGICSILNFKESLYISSTNVPYLEKYDVRNKAFIPASSPLTQPPGFGHTLTNFGGSIYLFDVNGRNSMEFNPLQNHWNYPKALNGSFNYVRTTVVTKMFK